MTCMDHTQVARATNILGCCALYGQLGVLHVAHTFPLVCSLHGYPEEHQGRSGAWVVRVVVVHFMFCSFWVRRWRQTADDMSDAFAVWVVFVHFIPLWVSIAMAVRKACWRPLWKVQCFLCLFMGAKIADGTNADHLVLCWFGCRTICKGLLSFPFPFFASLIG